MIKVDPPKVSMETSYNACCDSVTSKTDKKKYEAVLKELIAQEANYVDFAAKGELYLLKEVSAGVFEDPVVIGELTKSQLVELYDTHMVKRFPGRNVYDRIRVSSGDRCPYCCDIGSVKNLDHYLPKKKYPNFSVLPFNLIPSCRDCNMGSKGSKAAKNAEGQIIHPYLDAPHFFTDRWLFARFYFDDGVGVFEYFVQPPKNWRNEDKKRVDHHFNVFELAGKFSKSAGDRAVTILQQVSFLLSCGLDEAQVKEVLIDSSLKAFSVVNHWEVAMLHSLLEADLRW